MIQENDAYKQFIDRYGLMLSEQTTTKDVKKFFEELVDMIGEDIIRNHLKRQMKNVRWHNEQNDSLRYEKKIEELKKQIKELEEKKQQNDKDNKFL